MRTSWAEGFRENLLILAAMSGVFLSRLTVLRAQTTAIVLATTILLAVWHVGYFVLFSSFSRRGIAERLREQFGVARGFAVYESVTALLFFVRGVTFAWLVGATSHSIVAVGPLYAHLLLIAGWTLAVAGTLINVWATRVVGLDTYYYRDLFVGTSPKALKTVGPYRFFRNPMYGVGQAGAYGVALASLSPAGILATLLNQLTMYLFNELVEQPHLAAHGLTEPKA